MDAIKQIEKCRQAMQERTKPAAQSYTHMNVGEGVRQGDVYIRRAEAVDESRKRWTGRQIALGTTQGSRHMIREADMAHVRLYQPGRADYGPSIVADAPWTLEHPEHADITFPAGKYVTWYQQEFTAGDVRRVID